MEECRKEIASFKENVTALENKSNTKVNQPYLGKKEKNISFPEYRRNRYTIAIPVDASMIPSISVEIVPTPIPDINVMQITISYGEY